MYFFFFDTMKRLETPFLAYTDTLSNDTPFFFFHLDLEDKDQRKLLDSYFVSICEGKDSNSTVELAKDRLIRTFKTKVNDQDWLMGATAELYLHLFMNVLNFNQEFLYTNLEEKSIKKGFDGVYRENDNSLWFLESKSGADTTQNISHLSKVKEAYKDLLNKFSGKKDNEKEPNDPWWNAFNHAKASGSSQDIKDLLKDLSDKYVKEIYPDIKDYNIIPCGTVFIVSEKEPDDFNDVRIIKNQIEEYFKDKEYKNLIVICSTQKSYNSFLDYLGVPYEK